MTKHVLKNTKTSRRVIATLLTAVLGSAMALPSSADRNTGVIDFSGTEFTSGLNEIARHVGKFQASTDGDGYDNSGNVSLKIVRPAGATGVEAAYLTSLGVLDDGAYDPPETTLDGKAVTYSYRSAYGGYANHLADVTSIVEDYLDGNETLDNDGNYTSEFSGETTSDLISIAATLEQSATTSWGSSKDYHGLLLTVVFEDPTMAFDSTVIIMFGNASSSGQETNFSFSTLGANAPAKSWMAVGVAWSYNGGGEVSTIEASTNQVSRPADCTTSPTPAGCITKTAGGYDDGGTSPQQLITMGGVGDSRDNDYGTATQADDDELYNLDDLLTAGTNEVTLYSANTSANDNFGMLTVFLPLASNSVVSFNAGGGSGTMANQSASSATALSLNTFTRTGYEFAGWRDSANNSYADGGSYAFALSTTMTAQWRVTYTITYDANGGSGTIADSVEGLAFNLSNGSGFSRSGFSFAGWNTVDDGSGTDYVGGASFTPSANLTLYAQWTEAPEPDPSESSNPVSPVFSEFQNYSVSFSPGLTNLHIEGRRLWCISSVTVEGATVSFKTGFVSPRLEFMDVDISAIEPGVKTIVIQSCHGQVTYNNWLIVPSRVEPKSMWVKESAFGLSEATRAKISAFISNLGDGYTKIRCIVNSANGDDMNEALAAQVCSFTKSNDLSGAAYVTQVKDTFAGMGYWVNIWASGGR